MKYINEISGNNGVPGWFMGRDDSSIMPKEKEDYSGEDINGEPTTDSDWDLLSDCCKSDFDVLGFTRDDGLWQEKCLKCGKPCEPVYQSKLWKK